MTECPACGVIVIQPLTDALSKRFIACECGITVEIVPEDLPRVRSMAVEFQRVVDEQIKSN